jgi:replicative DNA helicase
MGKTQTCVQIASNVARMDIPTGFISLEMPRHEIAQLIAAQVSQVPRALIASGLMGGPAASALKEAVKQVSPCPLYVLDEGSWDGGLTRTDLADLIATGCASHGWKLVVLDYLSLLAKEPEDGSAYDVDLETSTALKRVAWRNNIVFLVIAALRKAGNFKKVRGKNASDIVLDDVVGAGRITYDAANVLYVQGERIATGSTMPRGFINVHLLKTRYSGGLPKDGIVKLEWFPACGRIKGGTMGEA